MVSVQQDYGAHEFLRKECSAAGENPRKIDLLDQVQWPAMLVTLLASWLVASSKTNHRNVGFWLFLGSNALWVLWGIHSGATALVALQIGLAAMNIRGAMKSESPAKGDQND